MILLTPLIIAILIIGFFVILPKHMKENGFKRFWPRRKCKAYPLDESDFRIWSKDTVYDGDKDKILAMDDILLPVVKMSDDRSYADVYCTYWNE